MNEKPRSIQVIGSNVTGQAIGKVFSKKGFEVCFVDADPDQLQSLKDEGFQTYTLAQLEAGQVPGEISFITTSVTSDDHQEYLDQIALAATSIGKSLPHYDHYHLVVVKSSTTPGTTRNKVIPLLEELSGKKAGREFGVCTNPDYLSPTTAEKDFLNSRLVLIGELNFRSGQMLSSIYDSFNCPVIRVSLEEAELQKYINNIFNVAKITFFKEMRQACQAVNVDPNLIFPLVAHSAEGIWNEWYGIQEYESSADDNLANTTQNFINWAKGQGINLKIISALAETPSH